MRQARFAGAVLAVALAAAPGAARSTPLDYLPVGDPLEDEIRILDVLGPSDSLPRLGMRPLQIVELPNLDGPGNSPAAGIAIRRLRRALARDREDFGGVPGTTPRLMQLVYPEDQRLEVSLALEGGGRIARGRKPVLLSPTGLHARFGVQVERWVAHTGVTAGRFGNGLQFREPLFPGGHIVLRSEEAYLAYTGGKARWGVQMGRSRWHWGPGQEAALLLSKTSAPLTGLALHLRVAPLRADGMVFVSTLDAAGEKFAAHRLEWQPREDIRVGLSEAVRYKSARWEPLYWVGVLPYTIVQSLLVQDEPDSGTALRNNVQASVDAAWRVTPGHRVYGELLIDDLRTREIHTVSKYGYLVGWENVVSPGGTRLSWGLELARVSRFVYTSFFGRTFAAQDRPLGYPTGPDSRRIRLRAAWDPSDSWQAFGSIMRTDLGESGLDRPFLPTDPIVDVFEFFGVVEKRRDVELGLRFWPASGWDLSLVGGYRWTDDAEHVEGRSREEPSGELRVRIVR